MSFLGEATETIVQSRYSSLNLSLPEELMMKPLLKTL
jgi:hypothetical protein